MQHCNAFRQHLIVATLVLGVSLTSCGASGSSTLSPDLSRQPTAAPSGASPTAAANTAIAPTIAQTAQEKSPVGTNAAPATPPPLTQAELDATAQATPFDGGVTLERSTCCVPAPGGKGKAILVSASFDAYSKQGTVQEMRIVVEPGKDCRSPDKFAIPMNLEAPWEPYTNVRRSYLVAIPQPAWRILVQFRDTRGNIFPTPAYCDDAVGLDDTSPTPAP